MQDITIPDPSEQGVESMQQAEESDYVHVKFQKFVQLVASHNFEEVMKEHGSDDILVSPDLITDLANAHEESEMGEGRKLPVMLLVGIILGIIVTYLVMAF